MKYLACALYEEMGRKWGYVRYFTMCIEEFRPAYKRKTARIRGNASSCHYGDEDGFLTRLPKSSYATLWRP